MIRTERTNCQLGNTALIVEMKYCQWLSLPLTLGAAKLDDAETNLH
jgi:hypothetical protein